MADAVMEGAKLGDELGDIFHAYELGHRISTLVKTGRVAFKLARGVVGFVAPTVAGDVLGGVAGNYACSRQ